MKWHCFLAPKTCLKQTKETITVPDFDPDTAGNIEPTPKVLVKITQTSLIKEFFEKLPDPYKLHSTSNHEGAI